jgi:tRNA G10  N-methylase Trm11
MANKSELILAATAWPTNAKLIADCARLGYLAEDMVTLDPTYGRGIWWKNWRPTVLITHNRANDRIDFRKLPHDNASFDAVAFDPPYVCPGGRKTSNIKEMHGAYGMNGDDFHTPAELQQIINDGLTEMARVVKPRGIVLVKCKDYIWSGRYWLGTHHALEHALALGFELVDRLEHVGRPGPQSQTRQVHARRNLSTLFVLRAKR